MMKSLLLALFCSIFIHFSCSADSEQGIVGLWKSRDQKSDKPRSLVAIYKYKDRYYGRMLATYDDHGNINDTILEKQDKATGVAGNPPYCGMDFVYNLKKEDDYLESSDKYRGKIIDPQKGDIYNVELWTSGDDLIVRGKLWVFGKNIPWRKASVSDLPKGFSIDDIKHFVPVVPRPM